MSQIFDVQGMTCGHCENAVVGAIRELDPKASVQVDRSHNRVEVESTLEREAIARAIREEGYAVGA